MPASSLSRLMASARRQRLAMASGSCCEGISVGAYIEAAGRDQLPAAAEMDVLSAAGLLPSAVTSLAAYVGSVVVGFLFARNSWQICCKGAYCASTAFVSKGTTFNRSSRLEMCRSKRACRCCIAGASTKLKARAAIISSNAASSPAGSASQEELLLLLLL